MAGLPKPPALDDGEDQVQRTPRARRTEAAKSGVIAGTKTVDMTDGPAQVSWTDPATADDLESVDMPTVKRLTPKKGMTKPKGWRMRTVELGD